MILFALGALAIAAVFGDFLQTTLGAYRAGRLSTALTAALWVSMKGVRRIVGNGIHRYTGPIVVAILAMVWIALHWVGWTLVYVSDQDSLLMKETGEPAGLWQTVAFVGAALSTVGASRAEAGWVLWDVASALAAVNGMVVVTLSVTFVINITQTVSKGREFAVLMAAHDAHARYNLVRERLAALTPQIGAYPMALYFSSRRQSWRLVPAIDEFVQTTLTEATLKEVRPILSILPGLDASGDVDAVKASVRAWADRYTLERRSPKHEARADQPAS